jgi:hypothetical protein
VAICTGRVPEKTPDGETRRDAAGKRITRPCRAYALKGTNVCKIHGGNARQVKAKAQRVTAEAQATKRLGKLSAVLGPADPVDNPLTALSALAGEVLRFKDLLAGQVADRTVTVLYGIDVSSFQAGIDLGEVRREGFDFVIIKATQGSGYVNPAFGAQLAGAQAAGLITAAYHYVTTDPVGAQVANIVAHIPPGLPVIPDVENGSGDAANARAVVSAIRAAGHPVPLLYLPQWYWAQIGRPDLSGLPPLWSSKYPSTRQAPTSALYEAVPQSYWVGYGNLPVSLLAAAAGDVARR